MTKAEWLASTDPACMIKWLENQGYVEMLWDFTIACCRRIWDELPGKAFHRVIEHVERVGTRDIEDALGDADQAIRKFERRLRETSDPAEESRLNRKIGFGQMVLAFDQQDGASAGRSISDDLLAWAEDPEMERSLQAELLRQFVPDPSQRFQRDHN